MGTVAPQPAAVMAFLDEKAEEVDQLQKDLEEAHADLGEAEVTWAVEYDRILAEHVEPIFAKQGEKLPGEDVRVSMVRRNGGKEAWEDLRRAKAQVNGLEARGRLLNVAITARMSTLKGLQVGLMTEGRTPAEKGTVDPDERKGW